jgi:heme/copper-type cytochrome/quinol oxidase subunit 2
VDHDFVLASALADLNRIVRMIVLVMMIVIVIVMMVVVVVMIVVVIVSMRVSGHIRSP